MPFKFINEKLFDFTRLKAGIRINPDNEFLRKYDENSNSIFDADELNKFKSDLEPYIEDGRFDTNEAVELYAKIMNVTLQRARDVIGSSDTNIISNSFEELDYEQAKQDAISNLTEEADNALEMFEIAKKGPASTVANAFKEVFNSQYAGSKVYRQLAAKKVSAKLVERANMSDATVTVKQYVQAKADLFKFLLGGEKGIDENTMKTYLKCITPSEMNEYINRLVNADDEDYETVRESIIMSIGERIPSADRRPTMLMTESVEDVLNSSNYDRPLTFEEVYKQEYGIDFNAEAIQEYEQKEREFQIIMCAQNGINELCKMLHENYSIIDDYASMPTGNNDMFIATQSKKLKNSIITALTTLYGNDYTKINNYLKDLGFSSVKVENGELTTDAIGPEHCTFVALAKAIESDLQNKLNNNILCGKSIEDYIKELEEAHKKAYGESNPIDLAGEFVKSQQEGVTWVKTGVTAIAAIATAGSGSLIITGIGLVVSVVSGAAIDAVETKTKEGEISEEEKQALLEELKISGLLTVAGLGIGKTSSLIGEIVAKKCPKLLAFIAEHGSNVAMSCLATWCVTGELNLSAETLGEIINIAVGIAARRNLANPRNGNNGHINTRLRPNENIRTPHRETVSGYKKRLCNGKDLIKMSDSELANYYKKLVPGITDDELKCLIDQMHRIQKGEPRFLNTPEETSMLRSIQQKMNKGLEEQGFQRIATDENGAQHIYNYDETTNPTADIPFHKKELTVEQRKQLRKWFNEGKDASISPLFEELGTVLDHDVYLYRGVNIRPDLDKQGQCDFLNSIVEGGMINNNKFTSTASNINHAYDISSGFGQSYILKIKVPKGTKVLDMRHCGTKIDEFVLPPCSYKINHIDYATGIVDCDFILN